MHRRIHRTNRLTGSTLTLLTGDRLRNHFDRIIINPTTTRLITVTFFLTLNRTTHVGDQLGIDRTGEIAIHPDPVHLTTAHHLIFTHDRNIVFRLAGNHTGITAGAGVKIHRHSPLMVRINFECVTVQRRSFVRSIALFGIMGLPQIIRPFVERNIFRDMVIHSLVLSEIRVIGEHFHRSLTGNRTTFHAVVLSRQRQRVFLPNFRQGYPADPIGLGR